MGGPNGRDPLFDPLLWPSLHPLAKSGEGRPFWPSQTYGGATWPNPHPMAKRGMAIPNLRGAYMAKGERGPPSLAIPLRGGCLYGLRGGWGVPTWPKREVGEPFGPFGHPLREGPTWPKKGGLRPYGQNPNLRPLWPNEGGPSPTGEAPPLRPLFGQKCVWPSPTLRPMGEGGSLWPKERLAIPLPTPTGGAGAFGLWEWAAAPSLRPERGAFGYMMAKGERLPRPKGRAPLRP